MKNAANMRPLFKSGGMKWSDCDGIKRDLIRICGLISDHANKRKILRQIGAPKAYQYPCVADRAVSCQSITIAPRRHITPWRQWLQRSLDCLADAAISDTEQWHKTGKYAAKTRLHNELNPTLCGTRIHIKTVLAQNIDKVSVVE